MNVVYWSHTYDDLSSIIALKVQYEMAVVYQQYESLNAVAANVFGKKDDSDGAVEITTAKQLSAIMEEMTRSG